jgi:hypothetical protein
MTIQLGMLGSDGVILAGDTRIHRNPLSGMDAPWHFYSGPKIKISDSERIAVTCARDMQTANDVADSIFANMTHGDHPDCQRQIREIAVSAARGRDVECLICFVDPLPSLYQFQYVNAGEEIYCQRITTCVPAGDLRNPAVFWGMKYYDLLPLDQLRDLAACMIVSAGELNSAAINGLEVVLCTREGCKRLPEEAARALESDAKSKMRRIGEIVLGRAQ